MKRNFLPILFVSLLAMCPSLAAAPQTTSTKQFVYVSNQGDGTISGFGVNSSGQLTPLTGSPFDAGVGPASMTADSNGTHLYIADTQFIPGVQGSNCNAFNGEVEVHKVDQTSGSLSPLQTVTLPGVCATDIAMDKAGKNLYVLLSTPDQSEAIIAEYDVNPVSGELTELGTASLGSAISPAQIVVDPGGKFVYASDEDGVFLFRRNPSTGSLGNPSQQWSDPSTALAINNKALFVATSGFHNTPFILEFSVNNASGALTFLWSVNPDDLPNALDLTTNNNFLATSNPDDNSVSNYQVPSNGHFVAVPNSPFHAGTLPVALSFDVSNSFLYNVNFVSGNVSAYQLNSKTGNLTPIAGSPFATGNAPAGIVVLR